MDHAVLHIQTQLGDCRVYNRRTIIGGRFCFYDAGILTNQLGKSILCHFLFFFFLFRYRQYRSPATFIGDHRRFCLLSRSFLHRFFILFLSFFLLFWLWLCYRCFFHSRGLNSIRFRLFKVVLCKEQCWIRFCLSSGIFFFHLLRYSRSDTFFLLPSLIQFLGSVCHQVTTEFLPVRRTGVKFEWALMYYNRQRMNEIVKRLICQHGRYNGPHIDGIQRPATDKCGLVDRLHQCRDIYLLQWFTIEESPFRDKQQFLIFGINLYSL